jgi:hypothetical protein
MTGQDTETTGEDSEVKEDTFSSSIQSIMKVGPSGEEGINELTPYEFYDMCDMVLARDIDGKQQLYNNYGAFNNRELLSRYGFIDQECQTDTVCLRQQIFDFNTTYLQISPERRDFWKQKGFEECIALAKFSPDHEHELQVIIEGYECPPTGDDFVTWSLSIGKSGWIPFPLKIWGILVLLPDDEWEIFKGCREFILPYINMFESPTVRDSELDFYDKWLTLFRNAVTLRYLRYQDVGREGISVNYDHSQRSPEVPTLSFRGLVLIVVSEADINRNMVSSDGNEYFIRLQISYLRRSYCNQGQGSR